MCIACIFWKTYFSEYYCCTPFLCNTVDRSVRRSAATCLYYVEQRSRVQYNILRTPLFAYGSIFCGRAYGNLNLQLFNANLQ